jgi:iron complex transport system substrate-binding protein
MSFLHRAGVLTVIAALLILAGAACADEGPGTVALTATASSAPTSPPESAATPAPTATPTAEPVAAIFPFTVTGSNGNEITFEEPPERIVAIDSAVVETLFAIGEGHRLVGTHDFVSYPPEARDIPRLGGAFNLNFEATLGLDSDLVFVFSEGPVVELERLGLRVLYLQSVNDDFRRVSDNIRMWGRIVGNPSAAEIVAFSFDSRVARLERAMAGRDDGPSVFQDEGELWTPGPDTLIGEVFRLLKLQNIAHDVSGYAQLSPEVIVERSPQIVIASYGDNISTNPAFAEMPAVKNKRIFIPEADVLSIPGPRYIDGIEALASWIYQGLFD